MFGRLLDWYTIYRSSGAFASGGILPRAKLTLRPSLAFSYIGNVTARHSSSGRQPNLWCGTGNGIIELSQTAPPIFGWAAITLGIGPHSSFYTFDCSSCHPLSQRQSNAYELAMLFSYRRVDHDVKPGCRNTAVRRYVLCRRSFHRLPRRGKQRRENFPT